jgi:hypothetical protein
MENQPMNLISPKGTLIVATLERLSGRALIVPGSARPEPLGGFSFDYQGTTDIYWDEQRTVLENDERVFVDEEGTEYLESKLRLVPQQEEQEMPPPPPEQSAKAVTVITVTVEGGVVQAIDGIPAGVTIRVLDFDTDGAQEESLTALPNGAKASVSEWSGTTSSLEDTT